MKQKPRQRISLMEKVRRQLLGFFPKQKARHQTREYLRWAEGWKRKALYRGKPLTRSMIRRVGSRARAMELVLIKA